MLTSIKGAILLGIAAMAIAPATASAQTWRVHRPQVIVTHRHHHYYMRHGVRWERREVWRHGRHSFINIRIG